MHNIITIYRFNTPFLDIWKERDLLLSIKEKLKFFLLKEFSDLIENKKDLKSYINIDFEVEKIFKIDFFYIKNFKWIYYEPIFKMDFFINREVFLSEKNIKKTILFLNSFFECFDWLNEKEYLIDIDDSIFYKNGFFTKVYPIYDFQNIDIIKKQFEKEKWINLLQDFIIDFKDKDFVLTRENSANYHKLNAIILYYIYLVYIMYQNIITSKNIIDEVSILDLGDFNTQKDLAKTRLSYVNDLSVQNFNIYYERLNNFFKIFE